MGVPTPRVGTGGRVRFRLAGSLIIVGASCLLAAWPILTPSAPPSTSRDGIDLDVAVTHVEVMAQRPRPMGSEASAAVRSYLVDELEAIGLTPIVQPVDAPDWFGRPGATVEIANVMARIEGRGDGDAIVFLAHYDTVPATPGANDDAAAVAALLEMARKLVAEPPLRNDIIVLFTDGEEPEPRFGASAFALHPWFADVMLAVNFEGIGEAGPTLLVEVTGPTTSMIREFGSAVAAPAAFSFITETMRFIGGSTTDFDVFRAAGIPGFDLAYARGSAIYHTSRDEPGVLNVGGVAHHAALALGIAHRFGDLDVGSLTDADPAVFFTLPGRVLVSHPPWLLWPSWLIGLAGSAVGVWRRKTAGSIGRGAGMVAAGMVIAALAVAAVWMAVVALRPTMGVIESYAYGVLLAGIVAAIWWALRRLGSRHGADMASGAFVVWTVIATLAAFIPAWGYFVVWSYAAGGSALALSRARPRSQGLQLASLVLVAGSTLALVVPVLDTFFLFAGPRPGNPGSEVPETIAVVAVVLFLEISLIAGVIEPWYSQPRIREDAHPNGPPDTGQPRSMTAMLGSESTPT